MLNSNITPNFDNSIFINEIKEVLENFNVYGIEKKDEVLKVANTLIIKPTDVIKPPVVAIKVNDGILGTLGNFSMIIGKAKSRKSFFLNLLATSLITKENSNKLFSSELPENKKKVLFFDTEQGNYHVQLTLHRICELSNIKDPENLIVVGLRSKTPKERLEIVEQLIYHTDNLGYVFIDGIKDLITSINDEEQATLISSKLLKWTEDLNIHISVVLHQNKSDSNARGHIGTELINKAETVISISRDEKNKDVSVMNPEQCRNREPEPIAFEIIDGLPVVKENYSFTSTTKEKFTITKLPIEDIFRVLHYVFNHNIEFKYAELIRHTKVAFKNVHNKSIGDNRIKDFITECKIQKYLLQPDPKGAYILNDKIDFPLI